MEKQKYFEALGARQKLPPGAEAYLSHSVGEHRFSRGGKLGADGGNDIYLAMILSGSAVLYHRDPETREQHILGFFLEGEFAPFQEITARPNMNFVLEFLEDTVLLGIKRRHFLYIPRIFPECTLLYHKIYSAHYLEQLRRNLDRERLSAAQRFEELKSTRPALLNLISVKHLASYLGMHPNTLSMLRGRR